MIKIIHISHTDDKSGAGIAAKRIHLSLLNNDFYVKSIMRVNRLFTKNQSSIIGAKKIKKFIFYVKMFLERKIIDLLNYQDNNFHSLSIFPSFLYKELNKSDFDIIHLHWVQHEMISIEAIGKIEKPIVWTFHDLWPCCKTAHYPDSIMDLKLRNKKYKLQEIIDNWCFKRKKNSWSKSINIVCPSKWMAKQVRNSEIMKNCNIKVIPNPLDTNIFKPVEFKEARTILNINPNKNIILFGSLDGSKDLRKGFDLFEKLIEAILEEYCDFEILTFGKEMKFTFLKRIPIKNLGKIDNIQKLATIYSASNLMVVPSRLESFGQTASEAQSCGTPVIAFKTSGLKDIVEDGETGYLIEKYNYKIMAEKIIDLFKDKSKLNYLGKNARRNAIKKFSQEIVAKKYLKLYKNIQNGKA